MIEELPPGMDVTNAEAEVRGIRWDSTIVGSPNEDMRSPK